MSTANLVQRAEFGVALDYGQFYLHTADNDPELAVTLLEQAQDADGIAQAPGLVVIESPHQNNFAMPLTVEVWDRRPADDLDEWQEAFEAHLEVTDGLVYESPTMDLTEIEVPPGLYHALITGRGFITHGWPGDTEPGDAWRIRLWPSTGPGTARRLRAFREQDGETDLGTDTATDLRAQRAQVAALRIKADLDQSPAARMMSGALGAVVIDIVVPGKIARYWFLAANLDVTGMRGGAEPAVGAWFEMHALGDDEDAITGTNGRIRCKWTELSDPTGVAMTWQWLGPEDHVFLSEQELYERVCAGRDVPRQVPRLTQPSRLRVQFVDATPAGGDPATRIHLEHGHVPDEWTNDLIDFWASKIDVWVWQVGHTPNWRGSGR